MRILIALWLVQLEIHLSLIDWLALILRIYRVKIKTIVALLSDHIVQSLFLSFVIAQLTVLFHCKTFHDSYLMV